MKQWNHHQKGQGNDKHDYGAAKQISGSFVTLFISKHGTLDEHSKTKAVNAGLITLSQHAGHLLISCPCQQVLPSARSYPYTCTTSTLASCLRTRNTGHVCEWLTTCDFRQHISSHLLCLSFLQARYGDFNIYQTVYLLCETF